MNESEFSQLAEDTLIAIEEAVENSGADIDFDNTGDILTLEFENASQIIINKQTPLRQIWVAARSGGYHFDYDAIKECWVLDSNPERELFSELSCYCEEQMGTVVELSAD